MPNDFLTSLIAGQQAGLERQRLRQQMTLGMMQEALGRSQLEDTQARTAESKRSNIATEAGVEANRFELRRQHDLLESAKQRDDLFNIMKEVAAGRVTTQPSQEAAGIDQSAVGPLGGMDIAGQRVIPVPQETQARQQGFLKNLIEGESERGRIETRKKILESSGLKAVLSPVHQAEFILDKNFAQNSNWPSFYIGQIEERKRDPAGKAGMSVGEAVKSYSQLEQFRNSQLTPFQQIDVAGKRLAGQLATRAKDIVEQESKKPESEWGDAERARLPIIARALAKNSGVDPAIVLGALEDLRVLNPAQEPKNKIKELQGMAEDQKRKKEAEKSKGKQPTTPPPQSSQSFRTDPIPGADYTIKQPRTYRTDPIPQTNYIANEPRTIYQLHTPQPKQPIVTLEDLKKAAGKVGGVAGKSITEAPLIKYLRYLNEQRMIRRGDQ